MRQWNRREWLGAGLGLATLPAWRNWAAPSGGGLGPIRFRNAAAEAGLRFTLENHPTPDKYLIETMPGGIAVFDYDNDGRPDIFFTNGAAIPSLEKSDPKYFNRLFRNEGGMKFTDVTAAAGLAGAGYAMGAAAADYDNDGHVDLLVLGVFRNTLYRNLGNGRFEDVTARAGIEGGRWSVAAAWFDYDSDGWLDLFVVNYAKFSFADDRFCGDRDRHLRTYCHPRYFEGLTGTLYRNRRDGTFEDVTERSGIAAHVGRGMSAAVADYDGDGRLDLFVTNDNQPNFLFRNRGDGRFEETGLLAGVALGDNGEPVSSMGADFRDYDNDGRPDLVVTDLARETFQLFHNQGRGLFVDARYRSGLGAQSAPLSGWGAGLYDFDNDGWKDLFTANSHVDDNVALFEATQYEQSNAVFLNTRDGRFANVSRQAGADFQVARAHRGAAFADFNGDGRIDAVTSSLGGPAELWENISPGGNHWIVLKLTGTRSNRDGIGAEVRIGAQCNHMTSAVGYASSSHAGVHFGLGRTAKIDEIAIRWPSGARQVLRGILADQVLAVREP